MEPLTAQIRSGWLRLLRLSLLAVAAIVAIGCTDVFFQPLRSHVFDPRDLGVHPQDIWLTAEDGVKLHAWLIPAVSERKGTILFLHGNAENVSTHIASVYWLPAEGYEVLLLEYRGYGRSGGEPSFAGLLQDVAAADRYLDSVAGVRRDRVVLLGQSLGGALALLYAGRPGTKGRFRAVIADSAFADSRRIIRDSVARLPVLGFLLKYPLSWLIDASYNPEDAVGRISPTPVLILHSMDDPIVPYTHGEALFEHAGSPKELWEYKGAGHIGALRSAEGRKDLLEYLSRTVNQ